MAVFENKITLDTKQFQAAIKQAIGLAEKLPESESVVIEGDTSPLKSALAALDTSVPDVQVGVDVDTSAIKGAASAGDALADSLSGAADGAKDAQAPTKTIADNLADAAQNAGGIGGALDGIKLPPGLDGVKNALGGIADKAGFELPDIGGALGKIPVPQVAAAAAAIGAIGAGLTSAFKGAKEFQAAANQVKVSTGLAGEELQALEAAAKRAFVAGIGESSADALKQLGDLRKQLGDAVPVEQLDQVAKRAGKVAQQLGIETSEVVKGLGPAVKQFGVSFDEALNLAAAAAQRGAGDVGALLGTIEEFTPNAKQAGFSMEEFADILGRAGQAGVKDLAKVGDAFKELEIRTKSGGLEAELAKFSGGVAKQLQEIAKAGREGQLTGKEVLQQSLAAVQEGVKSGEITKNVEAQLLTAFGGSKAEDLGVELYGKIFSADNVDLTGVRDAAGKAGAEIDKQVAKRNPFETLQRIGSVILDGIGKPLVRLFDKITAVISKVFGDVDQGGDSFERIGEVIGEFLVTNIEMFVDIVIDIIDFVNDMKESFTAVSDVVGGIGEALGFGADETEKAASAANKQAEAAKKAAANSEKLAKEAGKLAKEGKLSEEAVAELAKKYGLSAEEAKKVVAASAEIGSTIQQAALDVNNLATSFTNATAAVGTSVTNNRQAIAQIELDLVKARKAGDKAAVQQLTARRKELLADARDAVTAQRNLDKTLDRVTTGTDPAAQKKLAADRKQQALDTATLAKRLEAERITDIIERTKTQLQIEREAALKGVDIQLSAIDNVTVADRQARALLAKQKLDIEKEFAEQLRLVEAQAQQRRFDDIVANEQAVLAALSANAQSVIDAANNQLGAFNTSSENLTALIEANNARLRASTDATVRAIVESTPQFQRAVEQVQESLSRGLIDADTAAAQIKELRSKVEAELLGATGDNPLAALGQQLRNAYDQLGREQAAFTKQLNDTVLDQALQKLQSPTVKAVETTVRELERQRDLLLQNKALSADQRSEIEASFGQAIDKARKPAARLSVLVGNIADSVNNAQFDATGLKEGAEAATKLAEDAAKIREEFERGNITYQEAQERLGALSETASTAMSVLQSNLSEGLRAIVDGANAAVQASNDSVAQLLAERQNLMDNFVGTNEEKTAELAKNEEQLVAQQSAALETIAASSAVALADAVLTAEDAGAAIKDVIAKQLGALVDVYVAPIIASFLATLGPFALPAAKLATTAIKALLNSALAGFAEGGYTGDGAKTAVAGIVHKGEFVSTKETTRKHRAVLEHLHSGKPLHEFPALQSMLAEARIDGAREAVEAPAPAAVAVMPIDTSIFAEMGAEIHYLRKAVESSDAFKRQGVELEVHADSGTVIKQMRKKAIRRARS